MDRCGKYLQIASPAAKRRFGARALIVIEEQSHAYPESDRWCAKVKVRNDTMLRRSGPLPHVAAKLLANELVEMVAREGALDRAIVDRAAVEGVG